MSHFHTAAWEGITIRSSPGSRWRVRGLHWLPFPTGARLPLRLEYDAGDNPWPEGKELVALLSREGGGQTGDERVLISGEKRGEQIELPVISYPDTYRVSLFQREGGVRNAEVAGGFVSYEVIPNSKFIWRVLTLSAPLAGFAVGVLGPQLVSWVLGIFG